MKETKKLDFELEETCAGSEKYYFINENAQSKFIIDKLKEVCQAVDKLNEYMKEIKDFLN